MTRCVLTRSNSFPSSSSLGLLTILFKHSILGFASQKYHLRLATFETLPHSITRWLWVYFLLFSVFSFRTSITNAIENAYCFTVATDKQNRNRLCFSLSINVIGQWSLTMSTLFLLQWPAQGDYMEFSMWFGIQITSGGRNAKEPFDSSLSKCTFVTIAINRCFYAFFASFTLCYDKCLVFIYSIILYWLLIELSNCPKQSTPLTTVEHFQGFNVHFWETGLLIRISDAVGKPFFGSHRRGSIFGESILAVDHYWIIIKIVVNLSIPKTIDLYKIDLLFLLHVFKENV